MTGWDTMGWKARALLVSAKASCASSGINFHLVLFSPPSSPRFFLRCVVWAREDVRAGHGRPLDPALPARQIDKYSSNSLVSYDYASLFPPTGTVNVSPVDRIMPLRMLPVVLGILAI